MSTAARPRPMCGVGVLDKASVLLEIVEKGPATLVELVAHSGLSRPTTYRIAIAMDRLGLLTRDLRGRFVLGPRLGTLAVEARHDRLAAAAGPVLAELHADTGLDARLYRRRGGLQVCVASSVDGAAVADAAPAGAARPASAGPAAQVLYAWEEPEELYKALLRARFSAVHLSGVRRRGWAYGPDPMAPGAISYAVPVRSGAGPSAAALVLTGRAARMPTTPDRLLGSSAADAAASLAEALLRVPGELHPAEYAGS
ncbi:helix-turn-helix domain-containing protein (plasmid) [Streptomyces sp. NBC_00190]|uniref:helix-turn-helix domain-containing protein n=1 Tax=unclassified Streptomyces TaxID=2593676 RepID=UPI002E2C6E3A|nr:helix-turn-helix domain-containing protein [Streptomyces sp. NBC_00190]WSZ45711.1 helix-turn-helix domain-containing protein [Streptomyces sp. NBC_00868]